MNMFFWIFMWFYYILPSIKNNRLRELEDEAFWNWKPEICDVYYNEPEQKKNHTHPYFTRSKANKHII